jgi:hypothetical protein
MEKPPFVMTAEHDSECSICEDEIEADVDEITPVDGEWVHLRCAEDEDYV